MTLEGGFTLQRSLPRRVAGGNTLVRAQPKKGRKDSPGGYRLVLSPLKEGHISLPGPILSIFSVVRHSLFFFFSFALYLYALFVTL
jgi:hypothetical protein